MGEGDTKTRRKLRCHDCGNKFYSSTAFPECCPICGVGFDPEPEDNVISLPALRSATTGATDKVYRDMETASIHRAEEAARLAGVPVSDMSHLKITNLRDNVLPGESYAMPINNLVTQQMAMIKARGGQAGFVGDPNTARGFAQQAHQGYGAHAGAAALARIQEQHRK